MAIELQTNLDLIPTPTADDHVVNIKWVKQFFTGMVKAPVRLVETHHLAGSTHPGEEFHVAAHGHLEIDGEDVDPGDRLLLVRQTDKRENGIWEVKEVGHSGASAELKRPDDFNSHAHIVGGTSVAVSDGDNHSGTTWKLVNEGTVHVGTTHQEWEEFVPFTSVNVFAKEIRQALGDDDKEFEVEHNLGTTDVTVQMWNETKGHRMVLADFRVVNNNKIEVGFAIAPPHSEIYRVVVMG